MTWRQIVDRSHEHIEKLAPTFRDRVGKWYAELLAKRIPVLIYCSVRTPEEQDELYAQGRTKKGTKVTNARGTPVAQSFHCYGRAVDAVPMAQSSTNGLTTCWDDEKTYVVMAEIGEKYRLRTLSWETPHFEDADFKDWRELSKITAQNTPVSKSSTKGLRNPNPNPNPNRTRRVQIRKP